MTNNHDHLERDEAQLALDLLSYTNEHIFLTGKAGTGKTTFLKNFLLKTSKKAVVVAPTGVAAINAGGMTIHSLFQFPPGLFIPAKSGAFGQENVFNQSNLSRSIFLSKAKKKLLNSIDLLIIDEVSMLRADLLDAMDTMLRSIRRNYHEPMGGVQVLYIGDLWQLPPVVRDDDWAVLRGYYEAPFFFNSKIVQEKPPTIVELQKIYRQDDENFIYLLNNIRNNTLTKDDFYELNKLYQPDEIDYDRDNYIILTTHNFKANQINQGKMQQLDGEVYSFSSKIKGDFSEKSYPTETELHLKIGAQVMFLKNDPEEKKRYYNGKIASVSAVLTNKEGEKEIWVMFEDGTEIELIPETWNNLRFEYDDEEDKVNEKVLGTFTQYPVKLAWAVTIHKSQGLTFDEVVIDAGRSFSPGQVYVALSRCRTLKGITLMSEITEESIQIDERVKQFTKKPANTKNLELLLANKRIAFEQQKIKDIFKLESLIDIRFNSHDIYKNKKPNAKLGIETFAEKMSQEVKELQKVSAKFQQQLHQLFNSDPKSLNERIEKACLYFTQQIIQNVWIPFIQMDNLLFHSKKVKTIRTKVQELEILVKKQLNLLQFIEFNGNVLYSNDALELNTLRDEHIQKDVLEAEESARIANLASYEITLEQLNEGLSIAQIAEKRNLAETTIYSHAARLIEEEKISLKTVLSKDTIEEISLGIDSFKKQPTVKQLREKLNNKYGYGICQCVLNSL